MENRDKKQGDNSKEMSWWEGFPSHLQDLVSVVFWRRPCKTKSAALLEEAIFSVSSALSNRKQISQMFLDPMSYLDRKYSLLLSLDFPKAVYNHCVHFWTSKSPFNPLHCVFPLCHAFEVTVADLISDIFYPQSQWEFFSLASLDFGEAFDKMDCYHLLDTLSFLAFCVREGLIKRNRKL